MTATLIPFPVRADVARARPGDAVLIAETGQRGLVIAQHALGRLLVQHDADGARSWHWSQELAVTNGGPRP